MRLHPLEIKLNSHFIDRTLEMARLKKAGAANEACIIIMYGRRRVGKTELLEQTFKERNILKFEGIEGLSHKAQFANVMKQFSEYANDELLAKVEIQSWADFFKILAKHTNTGKWTIYLEELQWLANYESTLIAELKYVWDNFFRHNPQLIIILCGSAPSFMLDQVIHSKSLYNRSQYEFHLREFNLIEAKTFFKNKNEKETLDAYLTVGGIPEYLKWLTKHSSVYLSLCYNSFLSNASFLTEYEKIFTSNLAKNKHYKHIIEILSERKFATREDLVKIMKIKPGGGLTKVLLDLEKSGFIEKYSPFSLNKDSKLTRYGIADNYLNFYNKFIQPISNKIEQGQFDKNPLLALNKDSYVKWLGLAFERFCRKYHFIIANILGFSGVQYNAGAFYNRSTNKVTPGYQIDLIFDRADKVYTICEIKYTQKKVSTKVIEEFERKLELFDNKSNKTIHKILICNEGPEPTLENSCYFDQIITREDLFNPTHW